MGTLMFWGVIVLGVFLGIVLISLLSMAKKTDQIYDYMLREEAIATPAKPLYRPAAETLSPTSNGEARMQGDLSGSVAAPKKRQDPKRFPFSGRVVLQETIWGK